MSSHTFSACSDADKERLHRLRRVTLGRLLPFLAGLLSGGSVLAQPSLQAQTSQPWIGQPLKQLPQRQIELQRQQRSQQRQLNQERLRAEHGWQLHPRPDASWEERQREYELQQEFRNPR
jgi:hypothetical protein